MVLTCSGPPRYGRCSGPWHLNSFVYNNSLRYALLLQVYVSAMNNKHLMLIGFNQSQTEWTFGWGKRFAERWLRITNITYFLPRLPGLPCGGQTLNYVISKQLCPKISIPVWQKRVAINWHSINYHSLMMKRYQTRKKQAQESSRSCGGFN